MTVNFKPCSIEVRMHTSKVQKSVWKLLDTGEEIVLPDKPEDQVSTPKLGDVYRFEDPDLGRFAATYIGPVEE